MPSPSLQPRTLDWLLKLIDAVYRGKGVSDEQRAKLGQEPLSMVEYVFQHLAGARETMHADVYVCMYMS